MTLRILGGYLKGLKLDVNEKTTCPTGVMLKRRIFDARQYLEGVHFIDLCAGSGSVGIEALSRGATKVSLVESDYNAINCIEEVVDKIKSQGTLDKGNIRVDIIKNRAEDGYLFLG